MNIIIGTLFLIAFIPYIRSIFKGKTPQKTTWIIWLCLESLTLSGMLSEGAYNGQIISAIIGDTVIVSLIFIKNGKAEWTKLDVFCLLGGALGATLWIIYHDANLGIAAGLSSVIIGTFPTFRAVWNQPEAESKLAWLIWTISCVPTLAVIPKWTFADAAQPVTFGIVNAIMMILMYLRPWVQRLTNPRTLS